MAATPEQLKSDVLIGILLMYKLKINTLEIKYMKDLVIRSLDQLIMWLDISDGENIPPEFMQPLLIIEDAIFHCSDKTGLEEISAVIRELRTYQSSF